MGTISIHFFHLQLACNPQIHIKPPFLFKLIGFAGAWHWTVILCFGGFTNVTAVLHSPVTAEVHKDSKSEGNSELLSCVQVGRVLAEALHSPQAGEELPTAGMHCSSFSCWTLDQTFAAAPHAAHSNPRGAGARTCKYYL